MSKLHSRIAPTPSGFLHQGNAYNFLLTQQLTVQNGGTLRLRIDDLDAPRIRQEYIQDIFETLSWLGILWDEGPQDIREQTEVFSQQLRLGLYEDALKKLVATGKVFACTCSRKDIIAISADGQYTGICISKNIPLHTPNVTWRIQTPLDSVINFKDEIMGMQQTDLYQSNRHFIIRRRDGLPAYHIASLVDDVSYHCNLIVRGTDLLASTAAQLYLADLLGYRTFAKTLFHHHPLLHDTKGEKLSKSAGSTSIKHLRDNHQSMSDFRKRFYNWMSSFM